MVLLNTDIEFTSPSGGILQDVDRIEFIPLGDGFLPDGDSPNLPSGSLWLRPNDGQVERLNYQGTSGIFDVRNAEGCAVYTTTTLQASLTGRVDFETTVLEDSQFITKETPSDFGTFRIQVGGLWRITYSLRFDTPGAGSDGTMRANFSQFIPTRSALSIATRCESFVPVAGDEGGCCCYANAVMLLPRSAFLNVDVFPLAGADTDLVEGMVTFELIRPDSQDSQS
ncbi:MAG: hypothetical protein ACXABY_01750 [Candidatus Thorarchaeota archaeon]|jgi:hypothetical protein